MKCNDKQICVKKDDKVRCECKIGFYGDSCSSSFCDKKNNNALNSSCSYLGCRLNATTAPDYRFECLCDPLFDILNPETGKCSLIDPCSDKNCKANKAVCLPTIMKIGEKEVLKSECVCRLGESDNGSKCENKCKQTTNEISHANSCELDLLKNELKMNCKPGFLRNEDNLCYVSSDSVRITLNMVLRYTDEMARRFLPNNNIINACNHLADQGPCLKKYDKVYRSIYHHKPDPQIINHSIRTSIEQQLRDGFKNIIYQQPFNLNVISFKNLTEIDYSQFGFKTNYSVDILVYSKVEEDKVNQSLIDQISKENIKSKCFENHFKRGIKNLINNKDEPIDYLKECVVSPILYLYNLNTIEPERVDLCTVSGLIDCPTFSHCVRSMDKNNLSNYECVCDKGFIQESSFRSENDIKMHATCSDVDECARLELNDCDLRTTKCENKLGTFNCECNLSYKRLNRTTCEEACGSKSSFQCLHGTCSIFWDHYERCM